MVVELPLLKALISVPDGNNTIFNISKTVVTIRKNTIEIPGLGTSLFDIPSADAFNISAWACSCIFLIPALTISNIYIRYYIL